MLPSIDAGNSRFKYAIPDAAGYPKVVTNRLGEPYTDAVVYFNDDGTYLVGTPAVNATLADPRRGVSNWKRKMGTEEILVSIKGKDYMAKDILAILLKSAKEDIEAKTGEPVNEAVITVPANYTDRQKRETIDAAAEAGIKVLMTPNEPTAAALGNGVHERGDVKVVIFDFGGGTFDVSLVTSHGNVFKVIATNGEPHLGGQDINKRIADKLLEQFEKQHKFKPTPQQHPVFFQDMAQRIEQGKICLSAQQQFPVVLSCDGHMVNIVVTCEQFEEWVRDLVETAMKRTEQTLKDAGMNWADVDEIVAVGGSSQIPVVKRRLEEISGKKTSLHCEAHAAAALGGVIAGRLECERQGRAYPGSEGTLPSPGFYMHDILSHSLGVVAISDDDMETCSQILAKGTPIPSQQMTVFGLYRPNQTDVDVRVLQGEAGAHVQDCAALGHFELRGLPPRPDLIGRVEITMHLDANGMLTATARDKVSGKTAELKIDYKGGNGTANSAA